ncbi:MAG: helix-turn-helix domain-containing protein [Candidatus Micrarchaeota archaeon]
MVQQQKAGAEKSKAVETGASENDLTAHYGRQKKESAARLRVRVGDVSRIAASRYTIYDFADNAFSFSPARKELAIKILTSLRERPRSFAELEQEFGAPKSTLFLLVTALDESGLVTQGGGRSRGEPISLSAEFSASLRANADWWQKWSKK